MKGQKRFDFIEEQRAANSSDEDIACHLGISKAAMHTWLSRNKNKFKPAIDAAQNITKRKNIPSASKNFIITDLPSFNDLNEMLKENHIDSEYWNKHNHKLRATIVRTLDWVRDYQSI